SSTGSIDLSSKGFREGREGAASRDGSTAFAETGLETIIMWLHWLHLYLAFVLSPLSLILNRFPHCSHWMIRMALSLLIKSPSKWFDGIARRPFYPESAQQAF